MGIFDFSYKLIRFGIGGIFIYAGSTKLLEPTTFAVLIEAYGMVPTPLLMPVAITLPALEVTAGIGLLFDIEKSLEIAAGLLMLFIAILSYGILMGLDVDCGCFAPEDSEAKAFHGLRLALYRDLMMLAGIVLLYGWRRYSGIKPLQINVLLTKPLKTTDFKTEII